MSITPVTTESSNLALKPPSSKPRWARVDTLPYMLLVPSLLLIILIDLYPFLTAVVYSLQNGSLLAPGTFVGLQNYISTFTDPEFQYPVVFSAIFAVFSVVGSYLLGLGLALLLILGPIFFLSNTKWAVVSVIVIKIWRTFPFMMISLIAALQTIDTSLYEAARMDGAGRWASFRSVTFPGIQNISIILWILMAIWSVNDFETPFLLTQGGPSNATESLMILAYRDTFARNSVGSGSAVAFISLIILMILAIVMMRLRNRE